MRHVNQTRDGIIQALTPAPKTPVFRFRFYVTDIESGEDEVWDRTFPAIDHKEAVKAARRWGDEEFGAGTYDFNPVFGAGQ